MGSGARRRELLDDLALDPFHEDWDVAELHGGKGFFRVRIGDYRVVYRVDEENRVVSVERVAPRGDAYYD